MPAYSGTPGSPSKSVKGPGRAVRRSSTHATAPAPASSGGAPPALPVASRSGIKSLEKGHAPSYSHVAGNSGVYAAPAPVYKHGKVVGTSAGTVYHGPSPQKVRKQKRIARSRQSTVNKSRMDLAKQAIIHELKPKISKPALQHLKSETPKVVLAAAMGAHPKDTQKTLTHPAMPKQGPIRVPGKPNATAVAQVLANHGFNKRAISGVIGNATGESSGVGSDINPLSGTQAAGGILGFTTGDKSMAALQSFAASKGQSATDPKTQARFALTTIDPSLRAAMNKATPAQAAALFMTQWEAPSGVNPDGSITPGSIAANSLADTRAPAAQQTFQELKGKGGGGTVSLKDKNSPYVYPFGKGTTVGRTDMGVDVGGSGVVRALGNAKISTQTPSKTAYYNHFAPDYGTADQGIVYTLKDGPFKGKSVYVYENGFYPRSGLKRGQTLKKGEVIGKVGPGSNGIEMGFADATGTPLAASTYSEGEVTSWGQKMSDLISGKKVTVATGGTGVPIAGSTGVSGSTSSAIASSSGTAAAAIPSSSGSAASPAGFAASPGKRARPGRRQTLSLAARQRRALLKSVIASLGNTPSIPTPIAAPTSAPTSSIKLGL